MWRIKQRQKSADTISCSFSNPQSLEKMNSGRGKRERQEKKRSREIVSHARNNKLKKREITDT